MPDTLESWPLRIALGLLLLLPMGWFFAQRTGWRNADRFDQVLYLVMCVFLIPWVILGVVADVLPGPLAFVLGAGAVTCLIIYSIRAWRWMRRTHREMQALDAHWAQVKAQTDADTAAAIAALDRPQAHPDTPPTTGGQP